MQIDIQTFRLALAPEHREQIRRRASFALSRLQPRVERVEVRLSDINGRRGGVDKQCRVELRTDSAGTVVVTAVARDWQAALDTALARSARTLVRVWRRGRTPAALPR